MAGSDFQKINLGGDDDDAKETSKESSAPAFDLKLDLISPDQSIDPKSIPAASEKPPEHTRLTLATTLPDPDEIDSALVGYLFSALDKAVRARRLYQPNNPVYLSFVAALREAFARVWSLTSSLSVTVEEHGFSWNETFFSVGEGRDNLPFLFYKDGIRYLTFLPTFEEEVERFLDVVYRAKQLDQHGDDDMVTILWEKEFAAFQYSFVDALAEGLDVPDSVPIRTNERIDQERVTAELATEQEEGEAAERPLAVQQGRPTVAASITREDFEETMYFLDEHELDILRAEVELEWRRDLKADVLNALFDRLEDNNSDRQTEILRILRQLLPAYLGRGDLTSASTILIELSGLLEAGKLGELQAGHARELFAELSEPAVLAQLLRSLEEGAIEPTGAELGIFLRHLGSQALALLIRATETTSVVTLQGRLRTAVEQLGRAHPDEVIRLIRADDEVISIGATKLVGQMALPAAVTAVAALLGKPSTLQRKAAVEALIAIKTGPALEALQNALEDADRDVRISAARGLTNLRYQPARPRLDAILQGNRLKDADLTEKIAFFEAFGAVANAESVAMLDKLLNGKNLLRQKQSPEIRACAAMALGKVGTPASRASLERASQETNPMVRNAVMKAMRQEVSAS